MLTRLKSWVLLLFLFGIPGAAVLAWMQAGPANVDVQVLHGSGKHRAHGKLYGWEKWPRGARDLVKWAEQEERIHIQVGLGMPFFSGEPQPSLEEFVTGVFCRSDAVLQGQIISKASFLTENREWVFTDYELKVQEVLQTRPQIAVESESIVTITRTGGELRIGKSLVRATNAAFDPLHIGSTYLLFLTYLPETQTFSSRLSQGSFQLYNNKALVLTSDVTPFREADASALNAIVRSADWRKCRAGSAEAPR